MIAEVFKNILSQTTYLSWRNCFTQTFPEATVDDIVSQIVASGFLDKEPHTLTAGEVRDFLVGMRTETGERYMPNHMGAIYNALITTMRLGM